MNKRILRNQFHQVFHPDAIYVPMYERETLAERIILILLAINIRMFPKETDTQRQMLKAFLRRFVFETCNNPKLKTFLNEIGPYLEMGLSRQNAFCIAHRLEWLFLELESEEHDEELLIVLHAVCSLLFRNVPFTTKLYVGFSKGVFEKMAACYEPKEGREFMQLLIGNYFKQFKCSMTTIKNSHLILPTFSCAIYHFTERYLGHIWDPTDMCESPDYIEKVSELVRMISSDSHR